MKNMKMKFAEVVEKRISDFVVDRAMGMASVEDKGCTILLLDEVEFPKELLMEKISGIK